MNRRKFIVQSSSLIASDMFLSACSHGTAPIIVPPAPVPALKLGPTEIWLTPDIGSPDLLSMFSNPAQWLSSRAKVKVWKWYQEQLLASDPCPACGPNRIPNLISAGVFAQLKAWGIAQAIEVGAIKEWGCTAAATMPLTQAAIDAVNQNGGAVAWLAMDEPLYDGTTTTFLNPATTQRCGMTFAGVASEVNKYLAGIRAANPGVKIASIEPYPALNAATLIQWINTMPVDAFHVDVDHNQALPTLAPDLGAISAACRARGIPFGIIFGGQSDAGKDFITSQNAFIQRVLQSYGTPPVSIFQSWDAAGAPTNVPETNPSTLTRSILGAIQ